ncbi:MAG: hypothetical protein A2Z83_02050 [Omnitrophica bacterium GWA2_52_8]|nr:MAG: hypothetical protein A2Z83_02050 [Omnitrophica bacterium GWA2_52_8]
MTYPKCVLPNLVLLCLLGMPLSALITAGHVHAAEIAVPRVILGLFDSGEEYNRRQDDNLIHNNAEMVLNHLGFRVIYHDLSKGLPVIEHLEEVAAIFSWLRDDELPGAEAYVRWLLAQMRAGKKLIVFDHLGAHHDTATDKWVPSQLTEEVYRRLGIANESAWTDNPLEIEVLEKDPQMTEFERTFEGEPLAYDKFRALRADVKVYLKLRRKDIPEGESHVIVTSPAGGWIYGEYGLFIDYYDMRNQWRVNPFRFFEEALGVRGEPRYDTTTLFGRRIFYSHIDGDGFRNITKFDDQKYSGEVILDEILSKYPLPFTVSFIAAELDPAAYGNEKLMETARKIAGLPNVELGAHGWTHPLDWENQLTAFPLKGYAKKIYRKSETAHESIYPDAAVIKADRAQYLKKEIEDTVRFINREISPARPVTLNQWTGDCRPPAEGIALTRELGIENINGGDSRFDRAYQSYTNVAPLTRPYGDEIQVYASNSNENLYTNGWRGPFDGFRQVVHTFDQTEKPTLIGRRARRVSPVNVYYHFYSGEHEVSVRALKTVYADILRRNVIPVYASEYAQVVRGFLSGKMERTGDGGWHFTAYGRARTVRFDEAEGFPDLERSRGILGFSRWEQSLYVYLDEQEDALLYLTAAKPTAPYLSEASNLVQEMKISRSEISFKTRAFASGLYRFQNMEPGAVYEAVWQADGDESSEHSEKLTAAADGALLVEKQFRGNASVSIRRI